MAKGAKKIASGLIRIRIGDPIPTDGLAYENRDDLLRLTRRSVAALKAGEELPPVPWVRRGLGAPDGRARAPGPGAAGSREEE